MPPDAYAGDLYSGMTQFRVFHVPSSVDEAAVLAILELQPRFKSRRKDETGAQRKPSLSTLRTRPSGGKSERRHHTVRPPLRSLRGGALGGDEEAAAVDALVLQQLQLAGYAACVARQAAGGAHHPVARTMNE